jgi:hypothetical protein
MERTIQIQRRKVHNDRFRVARLGRKMAKYSNTSTVVGVIDAEHQRLLVPSIALEPPPDSSTIVRHEDNVDGYNDTSSDEDSVGCMDWEPDQNKERLQAKNKV